MRDAKMKADCGCFLEAPCNRRNSHRTFCQCNAGEFTNAILYGVLWNTQKWCLARIWARGEGLKMSLSGNWAMDLVLQIES